MRFRRFIITTFIMATLILAWPLLCTWKIYQLEKEYIDSKESSIIDRSDMAKTLDQRYGPNGKPAFDFPLLGPYYYRDIAKVALSRGADLVGGSEHIYQADVKAFIAKYADKTKAKYVIDALNKENPPPGEAYLTAFFDKHKSLKADTYHPLKDIFSFIDKVENSVSSDDESVAKIVREYIHEQVNNCPSTLKKHFGSSHKIESRTTGEVRSLVVKCPDISKEEDKRQEELAKKPLIIGFYEIVNKTNGQSFIDRVHAADGEYKKHLTISANSTIKFTDVNKRKEALDFLGKQARDDERVFFGPKKEALDGPSYHQVFLAKYEKNFHNKRFTIKNAKANLPGGIKEKSVSVELEEACGKDLQEFTSARTANKPMLAIVLDDLVLTAAELSSPIGNGTFNITFNDIKNTSAKEVTKLANDLNAGSLHIKLEIIENNIMGPSLGMQAQSQGFFAIFIGLILILLFMFFYYARAGLVANVALIFNLLFILGTLAFCGFELTLHAIAAVVLTMGTAVDLNVVCFQRIREELRAGISMRDAIANGYEKAMRSIMDSNITTLLTGIILYWFGIGTIKSFAATLIIGIICTFVTAMLFSQLLFDLIVYLAGPKRISFSFGFTENLLSNFKIDFISKRKIAYIFSSIVLIGGALLTWHQGLDYGTEFTDGTDYKISFGKKVDVEKIQATLEKEFKTAQKSYSLPKIGTVDVLQIGEGKKATITTNFGTLNNNQLKTLEEDKVSLDKLVHSAIQKSTNCTLLKNENETLSHNQYLIESKSTIDPTMAKAIQKGAFWAILLALIAMLCYIFLSFSNIKLAFAALIALLHDVGALFACLALAKLFGINYKITQGFITCTLTLIGYSINDTVIIFCRVREERKKNREEGIFNRDSLNKSICLTLDRTIVTSITTFLPVLVLYFTGGIALEPMAFTLGCGVIFGTYSSIFIATPIAYDMENFSNFIRKKVNKKSIK